MTRPKVPEDKRQRTAQACDTCKRRKQKVSPTFPHHVPVCHHQLQPESNWWSSIVTIRSLCLALSPSTCLAFTAFSIPPLVI
ncbi:hypothetical protein CKAH01_01418 [Colletotrichum kahawae]|uniref:Uncharacterized protein n=1 Tax=Colletotrichum kahawae TaxID=34407 RepID=A0AAD9Y7G9_COLKA|nr:hypothetical protein CKAH01_01418 [Colletotrichum kahawae]